MPCPRSTQLFFFSILALCPWVGTTGCSAWGAITTVLTEGMGFSAHIEWGIARDWERAAVNMDMSPIPG